MVQEPARGRRQYKKPGQISGCGRWAGARRVFGDGIYTVCSVIACFDSGKSRPWIVSLCIIVPGVVKLRRRSTLGSENWNEVI